VTADKINMCFREIEKVISERSGVVISRFACESFISQIYHKLFVRYRDEG